MTYGCEIWSLTLREECWLRVFESRIPRGVKIWSGESSNNEELHTLYRSPNVVSMYKTRRVRWSAHVARLEEVGSALNV
jgi:hypothetical protein